MKWDEAVDVVCTGPGAGGLATAINVVDLGGTVYVANSSGHDDATETRVPSPPRAGRPWPGVDVADSQTNEYLAALASDLGPLRRRGWDIGVPIRSVREPVPVESSGAVVPFVGSRLRDWAARCVASPYGYVSTNVSDWGSTTLHTCDGDVIEVAEIGSMAPDPDDRDGSVLGWLTAQADDRRIEVHPNSSLQRLVFEDGHVVGAVITTHDGTLAIRARHGVNVANGGQLAYVNPSYSLPAGAVRVCVVSQHASRFGRLELLTSEPLAPHVPSACRPVNRALHVNLHEAHDRSHPWRCGKVHGYPPLDQ